MFSAPQYTTSELQPYNYFVMQEPVFEEKNEEPVFTCVYEEKGVLYCATSTSKRGYYYTYALNNPLTFSDPTGYYVNPIVASDQGVLNWLGGSIRNATSGGRIPYQNAGSSPTPVWMEGPEGGYFVTPGVDYMQYGPGDQSFMDFMNYLTGEFNEPGFTISLGVREFGTFVVGTSALTGDHTSFGAVNIFNYFDFDVATVYYASNDGTLEAGVGQHLIGPALVASGIKINALKPVGALGSKPGSSVASYTLSKAFPQTFTKTLGKKVGTKVATRVGTNVIGRALGRFVPYVGAGLTGWDIGWYFGTNYGISTWFDKPEESRILQEIHENGIWWEE